MAPFRRFIDSAVIKNDLATLTAPIENPQILYALKVKGMRGSIPFFADNKDVTIVGDMHNPDAVTIMASETQGELDAYYDQISQLQSQVMEHYQAMNKAIETNDSLMMDSLTQVGTFGTANTIIIYNDKVVVDEPSIVAMQRDTKKIIAVGKRAMMMHGKTHENIKTH